jgi:hypothetical protein
MVTIEDFSTQFVNNIINNSVNKLSAKFISLGRHCDIKEQINKFTKEPTLFFDWLRSDFKAVLKVLSYTNILDELLFHDNIITYSYNKYDMGVEFKNMIVGNEKLFLLSHHDITTDTVIDKDVIQNFINKYERRWHRIMNIINNSNKLIIFVHRITDNKIDPGDEDKFIELISTINPNCKFYLIFLIHNEESPETIIEKRNNFLYINMEPFMDTNFNMEKVCDDWELNRYNWNKIFEIILYYCYE